MTSSLKGLKIAIYARFSSDHQRDTSLTDQVRLCTDFIEAHGGKVDPNFVLTDRAVSGAVKDRPAFERLQRLVARGAVEVVVCESADRLSRDLGDADRLWKLIDFHRVRLILVSDSIDSINEASRMHFRFKAIFADEYLTDLGKKTLRGLLGANDRGTATGGLPYGYSAVPLPGDDSGTRGRQIIIDDAQKLVVQRIFEMYAAGHSYLSIASTLNGEHVPPPRAHSKKRPSRFWKKGTIREMPAQPGVHRAVDVRSEEVEEGPLRHESGGIRSRPASSHNNGRISRSSLPRCGTPCGSDAKPSARTTRARGTALPATGHVTRSLASCFAECAGIGWWMAEARRRVDTVAARLPPAAPAPIRIGSGKTRFSTPPSRP
jgi:DNA invertase Pin-like site-specific DNA recombinase